MPTVEENLLEWNQHYDWSRAGDEWSAAWRTPHTQWYGCLLPRLHPFLPVSTVLEIAPGHGRWTQMLRGFCQKLIAVDLSRTCIEACKQRFRDDKQIVYEVNDGKSLAMIEDSSIDFAFSFDSLVHADPDVLGAYIAQLARKLRRDGVGFIHHSNLGSYADKNTARLPRFVDNPHWRDERMTARMFKEMCDGSGLHCIGQELVNWAPGSMLIDCFSLFTPRGSRWARPNRVLLNPQFSDEAAYLSRVASVYQWTPDVEPARGRRER